MRPNARRHCPHVDVIGIYGDEINMVGGYRNLCRDCGRYLNGPVSISVGRQRLLAASSPNDTRRPLVPPPRRPARRHRMSRESWASIAGELDGTTGIDRLEEELAEARDEITRLRVRLSDSWYVDIGERLDAALAEVARLRQGIEGVLDDLPEKPYDAEGSIRALLDAPSTAETCPSCGSLDDCGETGFECGHEFHGNGEH